MINEKYYNDIKDFPQQFIRGLEKYKDFKVEGEINRVIICGMGGSSLYVEVLNNYLNGEFQIEAHRGYDIPNGLDDKTLIIAASHSGTTEETISSLEEALAEGHKIAVLTSGGKLKEEAVKNNLPIAVLEGGTQPRLTTGLFISAVLCLLMNSGLIKDKKDEVIKMANQIDGKLDEEYAKKLAMRIKSRVPVIYSTNENYGIARVIKIKFNENAKTQSFWNFFPEIPHNEMVGYTGLVMAPIFLIFKSQYTHPRNHKRIEIFAKLMQDKGVDCEVIDMKGDNNLEEMFNAYYLADHITYYLAQEYGIDPEPVKMVEDFKQMLNN
jgi:glucose/mannose-6-phosphate isomerase